MSFLQADTDRNTAPLCYNVHVILSYRVQVIIAG